jgi:hypothetical protein
MAVEFVLKLLGRIPLDYFDLQQDWINRPGGALGFNDFREFGGQTLHGVRFKAHYTPPVRGEAFPLEELFSVIDHELASGTVRDYFTRRTRRLAQLCHPQPASKRGIWSGHESSGS